VDLKNIEIGSIYLGNQLGSNGLAQPTLMIVTSLPAENGELSVLIVRSDGSLGHKRWTVALVFDEIEGYPHKGNFSINLAEQTFVSVESLDNRQGKLKPHKLKEILKKIVWRQTEIYYQTIHQPLQQQLFLPGETHIPYAGRVFDQHEMINLVDSSLDFWLTSGSYTAQFESAFAQTIGVRYCSLVNSGSSANLVAFMSLTSPKLRDQRIMPGDEVITLAAGFPTTVNPILQYGAIPVFVDITLPTYNIDISMLEEARTTRTKAVMVAHTLGNPFDLDAVQAFCKKYDLWLIEDNCDALGSTYRGELTGSFGEIATSSFYPPHHITMGEGGAVYTKSSRLKFIIESFRDWGRDCYCASGEDNTCKKRFEWEVGELPKGYDHKYIYSHFGYNLKATEMQAAIGCEQLNKLDHFTEQRRKNWQRLYKDLKPLEEFFIFPEPTPKSSPSWFGFILTLRDSSVLSREKIVRHLESKEIQTRMLFSGNFLRHPVFDEYRASQKGYRISGSLAVSDRVMRDSFWVGVYPGMTVEMLDYIVEQFYDVCEK
jgi:CDP-6-deoxy-D-xylo-4-hexulose-3-dehydrase